MPGVGAEAGLGPNAQQALGIDPSQLTALMKIPKAKRDRAKEMAEASANMGLAILTAPPVQRPFLDQQARQKATEIGIDPNLIPPVGSQQYESFWRGQIAQGNKLKTLLDQVPDTPAGYQRAEGGLEFTPGGPADPVQAGRLAKAKREPKAPTERQLKIKELMARGVSREKAEDVASGRVRVSTDPVTGAIRLVNVTTGEVSTPTGQPDLPKKTRAEMSSQIQEIGNLLDKMPSLQKAIEKGVGAIPALKEFGGKVLGQFPTGSMDIPGIGEVGTGEAAVDPEVVGARTQLRIFREDVIAAFRKSGKVPVQEQQRILQFVDKLGVLNSVPDAKLAFQQIEKELQRIVDTYGAQLKRGTSASTNKYSDMSDQEILELLKQQGHDIGQ
jgi:hypothetical protein